MTELPEHVRKQLRLLIEEGLPADEIAFMMQLSREVVEAEIERAANARKGTPTSTSY